MPQDHSGAPIGDWHPADVTAELKKRGRSHAGLAIANGYDPSAVGKALKKSWPAIETIIAEAIGVAPDVIWPSRYSGNVRRVVRHRKPPTPLVQRR
jgi:Ner family transcriptional regulator